MLGNCQALDIEEWCASMMFEIFIEPYGGERRNKKEKHPSDGEIAEEWEPGKPVCV